MPKILIVYASLTGSNEEIAHMLADYFKALDCEDVQVLECQQVNATACLDADISVVSTYTFGSQGELPDEIVDFYEALGQLNLRGKVFGAIGSGEEFYGYFCQSVEEFDRQFEKTGATRGSDLVKIELLPEEEDKKRMRQFVKELVATYQQQVRGQA